MFQVSNRQEDGLRWESQAPQIMLSHWSVSSRGPLFLQAKACSPSQVTYTPCWLQKFFCPASTKDYVCKQVDSGPSSVGVLSYSLGHCGHSYCVSVLESSDVETEVCSVCQPSGAWEGVAVEGCPAWCKTVVQGSLSWGISSAHWAPGQSRAAAFWSLEAISPPAFCKAGATEV